jgi:pyruvate ferredoxin oxidoreductase gamma subunit
MKQIRIHGRGGQGVVSMAEVLAIAFFKDGKISQAFPSFGVERSGAPIQSFVRISDKEISSREHVYNPDILIVLDDSLIGKTDLFSGLKEDSLILINSKLSQEELFEQIKKEFSKVKKKNIFSINASEVALDVFRVNMVNTAMLGALSNIPGLIKLKSIKEAIKEKFSKKGEEMLKKNIVAVERIASYNFN